MRKFLPSLGYMLAIAASVYFLLIIFLSDVLLTVSYAIAGETFAVIPWLILLLLCNIGVMLVFWTFIKRQDGTAKREYLAVLGGEVYDRATDGKRISADKQYRVELLAYAVVATLQIMLTFGILYWPICFPIMYATFHIYDRRLWYKLHKSWADGRMRLNPNDQP